VFVLTPTKSRPDYAVNAHDDVRRDDSVFRIPVQNTEFCYNVVLVALVCLPIRSMACLEGLASLIKLPSNIPSRTPKMVADSKGSCITIAFNLLRKERLWLGCWSCCGSCRSLKPFRLPCLVMSKPSSTRAEAGGDIKLLSCL